MGVFGLPADVSGTIAEFQKDIKAIRVLLERLLELESRQMGVTWVKVEETCER